MAARADDELYSALLREIQDEIRAREAGAIGFLKQLIGQPSPSKAEGRVGGQGVVPVIWDHLKTIPGLKLFSQPIGPDSENVIAVLPGADGPALLLGAHTDVVGPGDASQWHGRDPYGALEGVVRYLGDRRVEISIEGKSYYAPIREPIDRLWRERGIQSKEIIYGRGSYDNKGCVAILALALAALSARLPARNATLGGDLIATFQVDEEADGTGIKNILGWPDCQNWLADAGYLRGQIGPDGFRQDISAIILEGSYAFAPVIGHRGIAWYVIRVRGKATHASTPHLGVNAVEGMTEVLRVLYENRDRLLADLRHMMPDMVLGEPTISIGTTIVGGGVERVEMASQGVKVTRSGVNTIPDWCEATIDVRLCRGRNYPDDAPVIPEQIRDLIEATIRGQPSSIKEWSVEVLLDRDSVYYPTVVTHLGGEATDHPLVVATRRSVKRVTGREPDLAIAPGATEAAFLVHGARIPTLVEFGPAGGLSHQPHEYLEKDQIAEGAAVLAATAMSVLGIYHSNAITTR